MVDSHWFLEFQEHHRVETAMVPALGLSNKAMSQGSYKPCYWVLSNLFVRFFWPFSRLELAALSDISLEGVLSEPMFEHPEEESSDETMHRQPERGLSSSIPLDRPTLEYQLVRSTLWPEIDKLWVQPIFIIIISVIIIGIIILLLWWH
jgi:hypothetical protein